MAHTHTHTYWVKRETWNVLWENLVWSTSCGSLTHPPSLHLSPGTRTPSVRLPVCVCAHWPFFHIVLCFFNINFIVIKCSVFLHTFSIQSNVFPLKFDESHSVSVPFIWLRLLWNFEHVNAASGQSGAGAIFPIRCEYRVYSYATTEEQECTMNYSNRCSLTRLEDWPSSIRSDTNWEEARPVVNVLHMQNCFNAFMNDRN